MESPRKKRKIDSQESQVPNASSTPKRSTQNVLPEAPSISGIEFSSSSCNSGAAISRNALKFSSKKEKRNRIPEKTSFSDLLDNTTSSLGDTTIEDDEDEGDLDYDEFFRTCKRIQLKGYIWNLYKPIRDDEGSLYHQITTNPRKVPELAKWFVCYCSEKPVDVGTYILYRFYFDCAGYQKFDLKKYFAFPPELEGLLKVLSTDNCTDAAFTTKKLLFADNAKLAKVLKFGIYNFLQNFFLEAHTKKILYGPVISSLLKLLILMCDTAVYRPLVYAAFIFVIKMLTSICIVKDKIAHSEMHNENTKLDNYINVLYVCFTKVCTISDKESFTLKIACLKELHIWIRYSAKVFVSHYNCGDVLQRLLLDESTLVRLAALESCIKIIQNEKLIHYLKDGPIDGLIDQVWGRVCDISILVQLKAFEVFADMLTHYLDHVHKKNILENLIEAVYHKDYRMGSAAGKCVMEILRPEKKNEIELLLFIAKIAKKYQPNLKSLLVESFIDHTNMLQNWPLIVGILLSPNDKDITVEIKTVLTELFLESVHITLLGKCSKVRSSAVLERPLNLGNHGIIANEVYPHLKRIVGIYRQDDVIIQNVFKILVKIAPEYLTKEHCEVADQIIQCLVKLFIKWDNAETLDALLNYLRYANQHLSLVRSTSKNAIEDLKKHVSEELYKSFKSKDSHTLIMAKKTSVVFSKFDLNEHIEWSKLLSAWTIIETNVEFLEHILAACHWSLMWRLKNLNASEATSRADNLAKDTSLISKMFKQFFASCSDIMKFEDKSIRSKAFERICESCISFSLELEHIIKKVRALEVLKPRFKEDAALTTEIMTIFELSAENCIPNDVARFLKYIMFIYQMAGLQILPTHCLSSIFKYFDKYYDHCGKLIERILIAIREKNENWIAQLLVNTISLLHQDVLQKQGVVDVKSREAKAILSLSKRFHEFKKIMSPKIAAKLLVFAVNYASVRKLYDFLIYVRVFTDDIQHFPKDCQYILNRIKERVPKSDRRNDSILYFVKHLREPAFTESVDTSGKAARKARGGRMLPPKLKTQVPKVKGKKLFQTPSQSTTESGGTDDLTIHDTSSDDLECVDLSNAN